MKKQFSIRILFLLATVFAVVFAYAQSKKVVSIIRGDKVINEYLLDDIDYIEVHDLDSSLDYSKEEIEQKMTESIDYIYLNITTFGPNGYNILQSMDGGMSTFQRAIFNLEELPSDEVFWLPMADAVHYTINFGDINPTDEVVKAAYLRMMAICSLCNEFIRNNFNLANIKGEEARLSTTTLHDEYVREAKILRSAMYFYLINEYGNVPYYDESIEQGERAPQLSADFTEGRRLVTQKVVDTLEELVAWYKENDPGNKPSYGHVGLDVAEALLVKFYLNYEVFTGKAAWDSCLKHAEAIIGRLGNGGFQNSGLAMDYAQCFSQNNRNDAANELIWRIPTVNSQGIPIVNYANGGFMLVCFLGYNDYCDPRDYNAMNAWSCMAARKQLTDVFDWNPEYMGSPDRRTYWWKTAEHGFNVDNDILTMSEWGNNGFLPIKYTNWFINDDGTVDYSKETSYFVDPPAIDFGMIRLAEIYLSAAEAILQGAGSPGNALNYVNIIRQRAGMPLFSSLLTMTDLQKERQRELYTECNRRTDLIRYGKWISGYNWNWKGGEKYGKDFNPSFTVYPLPQSIVNQYGYVQNPWVEVADDFNRDEFSSDELFYDSQFIYLIGSPNEWTEPIKTNANAFSQWKLWNTTEGSKIYTGYVNLPEAPVFRFYTKLNGWDSNSFGSESKDNNNLIVEFWENNIESFPLINGSGNFSFPDFKGGKMYITVDMSDPTQMTVTFNIVGKSLYLIGNNSGWVEPAISNEKYYEDWTLHETEIGSNIFTGEFVFSEQPVYFRFYDRLNGWDEGSLGAQYEDYPVTFEWNGDSFIHSLVYGKGSFEFPNLPEGKMKITVNLNDMYFLMEEVK